MKQKKQITTIFDKNIKSLKPEYQDIKDFIIKQEQPNDTEEVFVGVEEIDERKILYVIKEGMQYQLDSLYSAEAILDIWFSQFENRNFRSRFLLFGLGNGMYADKILQKADEESVIIVVEPSIQIFKKVIEEFDISHILSSKQVHLMIEGVSENNLLDLLRIHLEYEDLEGAIVRPYLNYGTLFEKSVNQFDYNVEFMCNTLKASNTVLERMGWRYYRNSMFNFPKMLHGKSLISLNKKLPKDIPAFIVSSGPSLDKNIDELKRAKNRGFIVAADSAVSALLKRGIIPDLMMTIDAYKMPKHFEQENVSEIPLVCSLHCNWDLLQMHKGDKYFVNDNNSYIEQFYKNIGKKFEATFSGGSVATSIFGLLEQLGFKTIVLVGQDLAFTNDKMYSANVVRANDTLENREIETIYIEGIDGEQILSSYEFQIYLNWFEEEIQMNKEIRVIDATEGGAMIHGSVVQTLKETIKKECKKEINITEIMNGIPDRLTFSEKKLYIDHMRNLPNAMREIQNLVSVQMKQISQMEILINKGQSLTKKMAALLKKVNHIGREIEEKGAFYYLNNYIQRYLVDEFGEDIYRKAVDEKEEVKESVMQVKKYYSTMEKYLPEIVSYFELKCNICCKEMEENYV